MAFSNEDYGPADPISSVDWNEVWRQRILRHRNSDQFRDNLHIWKEEKSARRYDSLSREAYGRRVRETLADFTLTHETRVLDIGAGTGTLALPMAETAGEICAVEPADGMAQVLRENLAESGAGNVRVVHKRWEDVVVEKDLSGKYDIVIVSLSLGMEDIRGAVAKMVAVARGSINLYWFVDPPFWETQYLALWPRLHKKPYFPAPRADCLFMVLLQMGIHPDVSMRILDKSYNFSSEEEMIDHFRPRFGVRGLRQEEILREYLRGLAEGSEPGIRISGDSVYARVWWDVNGPGRNGAFTGR